MVFSSLFPEKKSPIKGIPVIPGGTLWGGHLHLLQESDFQKALETWSVRFADEDGRCTFWMGPTTPSLSVTHCDDVQWLLKASAHRNIFPLMQTHFQQLFGSNNIGALNGNEWKQQRARITRALHAPAVTTHHEEAFRGTTKRLVQTICNHFAQNDEMEDWHCKDIVQLTKALTMDCFGQAAFHCDFKTCDSFFPKTEACHVATTSETVDDASQIGLAFDVLTTEFMRRLTTDIMNPASHVYSIPTSANRTYARQKERVMSFLENVIAKRQEEIRNNSKMKSGEDRSVDLITGFLEHFEQEGSPDEELDSPRDPDSITMIVAQSIVALLFAGYETSSVTLACCLHLLSKSNNKGILAECLKEIKAVDDDEMVLSQQAPAETSYIYLEAVLKETLRLYPPAISTSRTSDRDLHLPSRNKNTPITVPKGTYLYFPIWIIQRDPRHFSNPLDFVPERWLKRNADTGKWQRRKEESPACSDGLRGAANDTSVFNSKAWVPFSAGARACPGKHFAMQEMITILSVLLPSLSFKSPVDYVLTPYREGFVQMPKGGIPMDIGKRES